MTCTTRLSLEPRRTVLSGSAAADVIFAVGVDELADVVLHHEPPTPAELERAIDLIEDALMASGLAHEERGEVEISDHLINALPGLRADRSWATRDEVEMLFQRLASASLGSPRGLGDLSVDRRTSGALLILRECIHHLGFSAVRMKAASVNLPSD